MLRLTPTDAKDPAYGNAEGIAISMSVKFAEFDDWMPFLATSYDPMDYGRELYYNAQSGMYGPVAPYVPPPEPVQLAQPVTSGAQTL